MSSLIQKSSAAKPSVDPRPFYPSASGSAVTPRSVTVSATWDNCAASSPVLRSPNALVFSTRLALVNQGLMAARDQVAAATAPRSARSPVSDVTHEFELTNGSAVVSVRRLQRKCVLSVELASKTADEVAAVRAVFRSITELLGADREPVVAMQTGQAIT
ncbi:MAG: hypothetical protein AB8C46_15500 [Burkholderiaceae bacterium]